MTEAEIRGEFTEHLRIISEVSRQTEQIEKAAGIITDSFQRGGKIVLFGNGGSAADAQHIAAEMVGRFKIERRGLPAMALTTDTSILTAIGNDYGFEQVFARQVETLITDKDVAIGISTSGNSVNVLLGLKAAREKGARTLALTGNGGGKIMEWSDLSIIVPSDNTPRIQEAHILIGHILCSLVEKGIV
jgi:D-sedoheptulose 7-phosphate isomerase